MKKLIPFLFVIVLLTSCTTIHYSDELYRVDCQTSNSAVIVDVVPNGVLDSYASFIVKIQNNTNRGIYFFEDDISFWTGNNFISKWNSERYIQSLIDDSSSRVAVAALFVDLFSVESDDYESNPTQDFIEFLSVANLIATGIDAASTIENSTRSLLKSKYIPAGQAVYGFISCKMPYYSDLIRVLVNTNNSFNTFTFTR